MLVCEETSDESLATVRVFGLDGYAMERLCVVSHHAPVADTCAGRKDEFVFAVAVCQLVVGNVIGVIRVGIREVVGIDDLIHVVGVQSIILVHVFPLVGLFLCAGRIGCGEVVIVRDLEPVDLGIVSNLAMALVDHVFANGFQSVEFSSPSVAVDAHVADCNLFREVVDEAGDVDEIIGVGDEERVGGGHVGEIVLEGRGGGGAEETGALGGEGGVVVGDGRGLRWARCAAEHVLSVLFGVDVGSVGVFCGVCLSRGVIGAVDYQERKGAYPHGSHRECVGEGVSWVRSWSFWANTAALTGGRAATLRFML